MSFRIRPITAADQAVLWELLHIALWDPPPAPLRPREILEHPDVRIYAEAWGGTVHPENPAIALYERVGFRKAGMRKTYHLMVAAL